MKATASKYKYSLFVTEDGSHSLSLVDMDESFHSSYGALAESKHIYINAGLNFIIPDFHNINILEVGFGTGLNALLTYEQVKAQKVKILYDAIEPYPLNSEIYSILNYPQIINCEEKIFFKLHECIENEEVSMSKNFIFCKSHEEIQTISLRSNFYNLVYFDAFNPDLEPEIWSEDVFDKIYKAMSTGGVLVTYSTKGSVRRAMISVGFTVEKLPGPKGKREICRAYKD